MTEAPSLNLPLALPARTGEISPGWGGYLGDGDDGEDVAFAERKVLIGGAVEIVLGNTFCTRWPDGLVGENRDGGVGEKRSFG